MKKPDRVLNMTVLKGILADPDAPTDLVYVSRIVQRKVTPAYSLLLYEDGVDLPDARENRLMRAMFCASGLTV